MYVMYVHTHTHTQHTHTHLSCVSIPQRETALHFLSHLYGSIQSKAVVIARRNLSEILKSQCFYTAYLLYKVTIYRVLFRAEICRKFSKLNALV